MEQATTIGWAFPADDAVTWDEELAEVMEVFHRTHEAPHGYAILFRRVQGRSVVLVTKTLEGE